MCASFKITNNKTNIHMIIMTIIVISNVNILNTYKKLS